MKYYYKYGFYDDQMHANIPENAIELSDSYYNELIESQAIGKIIIEDDTGSPIAIVDEKIDLKIRISQIKVEIKDLEAQQDRPLRELELINNNVNPDPLSEFTIEQQKIKALEKLENITSFISDLRKELVKLQP